MQSPLKSIGNVKSSTLNCTFSSTHTITVSVQGVWNLTSNTVTAIYSLMGPGITESQGNNSLTVVDCSTFTVPNEIESEEFPDAELFGDIEL